VLNCVNGGTLRTFDFRRACKLVPVGTMAFRGIPPRTTGKNRNCDGGDSRADGQQFCVLSYGVKRSNSVGGFSPLASLLFSIERIVGTLV
jgi:hypothetical protein